MEPAHGGSGTPKGATRHAQDQPVEESLKATLVSLEPWDSVWRRNQHLSAELLRQGHLSELVFVEPARRGAPALRERSVHPGVTAVTPFMPLPRTAGGLIEVGARIRRHLLRDVDLLWINDPSLGVHCRPAGIPAIYDVTDDWRSAGFPSRITRRIIRAENRLATSARTIVCSRTLRDRWRQRYGVEAPVVPNGVDLAAWQAVQPVTLAGDGPHVGYVGTLHEHRLDVDLVIEVARQPEIGTVHLVGPNCLPENQSRQLVQAGVIIHGPVPSREVPSWMSAMDVLISPHRVDEFTLSLDAIKAYEYAASGKPVVATPTSGFQEAPAGRMTVTLPDAFGAAVLVAAHGEVGPPASTVHATGYAWADRAIEFWAAASPALQLAGTGRRSG